jgi:peptidyl-tRNA hydrolase
VEDGMSYLLSPMRKGPLKIVDEMVGTTIEAVKMIFADSEAKAMNHFNRKSEDENPGE